MGSKQIETLNEALISILLKKQNQEKRRDLKNAEIVVENEDEWCNAYSYVKLGCDYLNKLFNSSRMLFLKTYCDCVRKKLSKMSLVPH